MNMVKADVPVVVPAPAITKLNFRKQKRPIARSFLFARACVVLMASGTSLLRVNKLICHASKK